MADKGDAHDLDAKRNLRREAQNLCARLKEAERKVRRVDMIEESQKTEAYKQAEACRNTSSSNRAR